MLVESIGELKFEEPREVKAPAMPIQELIPIAAETQQALSSG